MTYNELLQTSKWKAKRSEILSRDRHKCQRCGKSGQGEGNSLFTMGITLTKNDLSASQIIQTLNGELNIINIGGCKFNSGQS